MSNEHIYTFTFTFTCALEPRLFVQACVLCGCDYVDSPPSVGVVTAFRLAEKFRHVPCERVFERVAHCRARASPITR